MDKIPLVSLETLEAQARVICETQQIVVKYVEYYMQFLSEDSKLYRYKIELCLN